MLVQKANACRPEQQVQDLGVKCSKQVAITIPGVISLAKLSIGPIQRDYWVTLHFAKVTRCCGSVLLRHPCSQQAAVDSCYH